MRRIAVAAVAVVAGVLGWVATAGAASTVEVVAVMSDQDTATMVVAVRPPPSLTRPGVFRVEDSDGRPLGLDTRAVLTPQLLTGVVLDTSAAGADALQGGINGASSFLLQLPDGAGSVVVGDGGEGPTVLAPLTQGAVSAIGALNSARAGGERHPGAALTGALAGLPARTGRPRLLLLHTGAPDAGGPSATALSRTLQEAGAVLAVVATGDDQRYWSEVTGATGGVLVSARGPATRNAFDQVARMLRERFVLTLTRPAALPATVELTVEVGSGATSQSVLLPADSAGPAPPGPAGDDSGPAVPWWVLGAVLVLAAVAGAVLLARRRTHPAPAAPDEPHADTIGTAAPRPAGATLVAGHRPTPRTPSDAELHQPAAPLPRRTPADPGRAVIGAPARPAQVPPPVVLPVAGVLPAPGVLPSGHHPAADERAYGRLDDEAGKVAALVAEGRMDSGRAIARIALAAPGRVDLLDRVLDVERRLAGAKLGAAPPSDTVLALLTEARRVVAGEIALLGPDGVRVEQVPATVPQAAPVLTLTRAGRVREFRGTKDLGRHVDLAALTVEAAPTEDRATS